MIDKKEIEDFRTSGKLQKYKKMIETDNYENRKYIAFLKWRQEKSDLEFLIKKYENVLENLQDQLLILKQKNFYDNNRRHTEY